MKRKAEAMLAFVKSELFLRFLGGFALGAVGMFAFASPESPLKTQPAVASPYSQNATL
jgi:hypothetical protein